MKQMTCEMCGSTELLKQDGVFVCQSCGCRYSVEEARKLLVEVDGVVNVQGTVQVDRSSEINNRIQNAIAEYRANHQDRAIALFNDVLNIDFENVTAIIYKACSDGWLSTLNDNHMTLTANELNRAVEIAHRKYPDPVKFTEMVLPCVKEMVELCDGISGLCSSRKKDVLADIKQLTAKAEEANKQGKHYMMVGPIAAASPCYERAKMYAREAKNMLEELENQLAMNKNQTGLAGLAVLDGVMDCMEEADRVCDGFLQAMTNLADRCLKLCSSANASHVGKAAKRILALTNRVKDRQEKDREERIAAYWEQHAEEKQALESEKAELEGKVRDLDSRMEALRKKVEAIKAEYGGNTPAEKEKNVLLGKRTECSVRLNGLGLFKGKEKKQLKEDIALLDEKLAKLEDTVRRERKEMDAKLAELLGPHEAELDTLKKESSKVRSELIDVVGELERDPTLE